MKFNTLLTATAIASVSLITTVPVASAHAAVHRPATGPRVTPIFRTLSKARVYTRAFLRKEAALWSSPELVEMCQDNSGG